MNHGNPDRTHFVYCNLYSQFTRRLGRSNQYQAAFDCYQCLAKLSPEDKLSLSKYILEDLYRSLSQFYTCRNAACAARNHPLDSLDTLFSCPFNKACFLTDDTLVFCPYCGPFQNAEHPEWFKLRNGERLFKPCR